MIAAGEAGGILDAHSQAAGDLHRKGRQAEEPGEVGDDLPDRGHRHRRRGRRRRSCGRSFRRSRVCSPASAPSCRCRRASSSRSATTWCGSCRSIIVGGVALGYAFKRYYATDKGRRVIDRIIAEVADPRADHAQDRGGAVLPHAVDADRLGRADSRRSRHHGAHRRQRRSSRTRFRPRARASSAVKRSRRR